MAVINDFRGMYGCYVELYVIVIAQYCKTHFIVNRKTYFFFSFHPDEEALQSMNLWGASLGTSVYSDGRRDRGGGGGGGGGAGGGAGMERGIGAALKRKAEDSFLDNANKRAKDDFEAIALDFTKKEKNINLDTNSKVVSVVYIRRSVYRLL